MTNEGRFAGHMIDDDTQLLFMDEWTSDSLSCEDAKRILQGIIRLDTSNAQIISIISFPFNSHFLTCILFVLIFEGGLFMLSQKHTATKRVNYRSGFFITTNVMPDFGVARDQEAVYRRLKVFSTNPLARKDTSVTCKLFYFFVFLFFKFVNALDFSTENLLPF